MLYKPRGLASLAGYKARDTQVTPSASEGTQRKALWLDDGTCPAVHMYQRCPQVRVRPMVGSIELNNSNTS
jgi:hypothetical protein